MTEEQINHAIALLAQPQASAKAQAAAALPAPRAPITREPGAWWELANFTIAYGSADGWQLTHPRYPAGPGQPIPVDGYPAGSDRLRRHVIATHHAAAAIIEDLAGRSVGSWEEDEDDVGDPYWTAHLSQATENSA